MQVSVENKGDLARQINVTIPAEDVSKKLDEQFARLAKNIKIDGFRPGKVPVAEVKKRHGEQVRAELAQKLVEDSLPQAIMDNKLQVAGQPNIHAHDVKEGEDYAYHAHVEVYPEVKVKGADKLKLTREISEPSQELLDEAMQNLQKQLATFEEKKDAAAEGDRVTINAVGKVDGKAFDGGKLDDFSVTIGSGQLIPGFEDGLKGLKAGDKKDLKVKFPAEYHAKDLAGKPAVFETEVVKVEAQKIEELNDDSVKALGMDSLAKLKEMMNEGAKNDLERASEQRLKRELFDQLDKANKVTLPESLIQSEQNALFQAQVQEWQRMGVTPDMLGKGMDEIKVELKDLAERRVKLGLVLAEIAKSNNVKVEDADLEAAINAQAERAGQQAAQVRAHFAQPNNRNQLIGPILEDKAVKFLLDGATITEKKVEAKELLSELQ